MLNYRKPCPRELFAAPCIHAELYYFLCRLIVIYGVYCCRFEVNKVAADLLLVVFLMVLR